MRSWPLTGVLVVLAGGCEAFIPASLPAYSCHGSDPTACPTNYYCADVTCVPCDAEHCSGGVPITGRSDAGSLSDATSGADGSSSGGDAVAPPPSCATGADCPGHVCGIADVLSQALVSKTGAVCTQPCCTSVDCPASAVCYGAGTGGSYCVNAAALGRPTALGVGGPGVSCGGAGDCRSGSCAVGRCVDTCCATSNCAAPTTCTLTPGVEGHTTSVCREHPGASPGAACSSPTTCASGVCVVESCRPRCCGRASALATGYHACELETAAGDVYSYATYPDSEPPGVAFGAACTKGTECKSRNCDTITRTCSDVCCVDADCSTYGAGLVCRPADRGPGTSLHLLCVRGP